MYSLVIVLSNQIIAYFNSNEFVKSRHSGENRNPDALQLLEKTEFQLSPE
jgi:hypothetical protein